MNIGGLLSEAAGKSSEHQPEDGLAQTTAGMCEFLLSTSCLA